MRGIFVFLVAFGAMGALSLPYESWGMPVWPVAMMTLASGLILSLIPGLEKYRVHLATIYFTVFLLMWLQSFPRPITPKATIYHLRGLIWILTYACFGLVAFVTLIDLLRRARKEEAGRKAVVFGLGATFMGAALAFASGPGGGADPMMAWFQSLGMSQSMAEMTILIFRKTIHFVYYGLLALLAGAAAFHGRSDSRKWGPMVVGFLFMLLHAVFDEFRQSNVSIRTGSWIDVGVDSLGALTFLWLAFGRKGGRRSDSRSPVR